MKQTVWTPRVDGCSQCLGLLVLLVLHTAALLPGLFLLHCMLEWGVEAYWYPVFHFGWIWIFGTPYALLVAAFKWGVVGRFEEGPIPEG